ncbi:MAG: FKBP-type peptidyl-prolyl cis-trans isomerase [Proteobacteria bacterium]|nr:FKBP-type peptidyl-prolyl cis-trans isomerase [Pseudomonadota bacterium]NBY18679.1 FKBP-type peptidyl-prolyl cis-trans isomerase [bacterium]
MKTKTKKTWSGLFLSLFISASFSTHSTVAADAPKAAICKSEKETTTLIKKDLKKGKGKEAKAGTKVKVHYTGCLTNGTKFDSSYDHGTEGFEFVLGQGQVIKGWDTGVAGMKIGGKRKLIIPSDMGYGESGAGPIPPKSTLVFEVELLEVN